MTLADVINRVLRDHEGYTGDGVGSVGPLPVGDRRTAGKPISKRDLRELLMTIAQTMGDEGALQDLIAEVSTKATAAQGAKADTAVQPDALIPLALQGDLIAETARAPAALGHDDGRRNGAPTITQEDVDGRLLMSLDDDGRMRIPHLPRALQDMVGEAAGADLLIITAEQGHLILRVDEEGDYFMPGIARSVQQEIRDLKRPALALCRGRRERFRQSELALLSAAAPGVPPPIGCYPMDWSPGAEWMIGFEIETPAPISMPTPYGYNHGVVHPSVVEFVAGWRGWRYVMGITGYGRTQEEFENPFLLGSNDLQSWTLIDWCEQPLAHRPDTESGHLSDIHLTHDPRSGHLVVIWRETVRLDGVGSPRERIHERLLWIGSADGSHWTEPQEIISALRSDDIMLSPSALYDPYAGIWHLYSGNGTVIWHRTAPDLSGPWSEPDVITFPAGVVPWHTEVRWIGQSLVMTCHDITNDNLFFGVGTDWVNWVFGDHVLTTTPSGTYKASVVAEISGGKWRPHVIWTSDASDPDQNNWWRLYSTAPANWLDMEA